MAGRPVSEAQRGVWFLYRLAPGSAFYNIPMQVSMPGPLDQDAIERALNEVIRRHAILRTTYRETRVGDPVQLVSPRLGIELPLSDLRPLGEADAESELQRLATDLYEQPFDLERGPVLRARLVRVRERQSILLLAIHHIAIDHWGMNVLGRELRQLYRAFANGLPSPLPELALQYADYAEAEATAAGRALLEGQLEYWRLHLDGAPGLLDLPADRPRPLVQSFQGGTQRWQLGAELTRSLETLARSHGATLYMTLLAGLNALVHRLTAVEDVVIGSWVAGRNRTELESLIGHFANTLLMRCDVSGDPSFEALLERVKAVATDAFANQDVRIERVVEELAPDRTLSHMPLCQVILSHQNFPVETLQLRRAGARGRERPPDFTQGAARKNTTKYDLVLFSAGEGSEQGLTLITEYSSDLFDDATITRVLSNFHNLLEDAVARPGEPISRLRLLSPHERGQLLEEWNRTGVPLGREERIHAVFEEQAHRTPHALALNSPNQALTYGELNARANRLARHLRRLGVVPGTLAAVCLERSPDTVVALLAILKAGAAYVPLDPAYPRKRLAYMLEDSRAPVVVTERALQDRLPETAAKVVLLDGDAAAIARHRPGDLDLPGAGPDAAYVIYTSGSTGNPKGVVGTHGAALNRFRWMWQAYPFRPREICCQKTALSFVDSVWEVFGPLLAGVPSTIIPDQDLKDPRRLLAALETAGVTRIVLVPSLLRVLLDAEPDLAARLPRLLFWVSSGEALPADLGRRFKWAVPAARLLNLYGSSEVTADVTYYEVRGDEPGPGIPIGRPISNARVYVLDRHLEPVPIGVPGEVYVGGPVLARGYLNRPDLTAERFVPSPFGPAAAGLAPDDRLYRTGDLARYRPDGNLDYAGRLDHQVKVRGFRIELGEIEAALNEHPAVRRALVVARPNDRGDIQLIAYTIADPDALQQDEAEDTAELSGKQLADWEQVWTDTYGTDAPADPTFDTRGWPNSYTNRPLPAEEMQEWVDGSVAWLREQKAADVLEIGCGSGLLLFRLAPGSRSYVGTDFSPTALGHLRQHLAAVPGLDHVTLLERAAHELGDLKPRSFDLVVLNSVVQYFPDADYLLQVIGGALERVRPGGHLCLGDVRSLPLLEAFHTSVELHWAADSMTTAQLRQRAHKRLAQEIELAVDPRLFLALPGQLSRITRVAIQPRRGRRTNEVSAFRYNVTLEVDGPPGRARSEQVLDWGTDVADLADLRRRLARSRGAALRVRGVPNARTRQAVNCVQLLSDPDSPETVRDLRRLLRDLEPGIHPEDAWGLPGIELSWAEGSRDGSFDVVQGGQGTAGGAAAATNAAYTNDPLQARSSRRLVPELQRHLKQRLPAHMWPAAYVQVDAFPLTPNGKLDLTALPAPTGARPELESTYLAPRNADEQKLARIFAEVLGVEAVGVNDDFFELGGHSLLATQLVSRVREGLAVEVPLRLVFEAPTVAGLLHRMSEASLAEESLPALRSGAPSEDGGEQVTLPASFAQERLWFLNQLMPSSYAYNIPTALGIRGQLDLESLKRALNEVVARHETLRSTLVAVGGRPLQVIRPRLDIELPLVDIRGLPADQRQDEARRLANELYRTPFDLAHGPLIRALAIVLAPDETVLVVVIHHIVADGWSLAILNRELSALYQAFLSGKPSPLALLPIQHSDFVRWQRDWLTGDTLQQHLQYWTRQLAGRPAVLELPSDFPRPAVPTMRGGRLRLDLAGDLGTSLMAFGRAQEATPFMTLLAIFFMLLKRWSSQDDIVVGTPVVGRNRIELETLIGFFVNTLALRVDLGGDPSFREVLERVRSVATEAYAHQDLPFQRLVEELAPARDLSHSPLYQVTFMLENVRQTVSPRTGAAAAALVRRLGWVVQWMQTRYDLTLHASATPTALELILEFSGDLFKRSTAQRFLAHVGRLIESASSDPDRPLSELDILPAAERAQVLQGWNRTAVAYPREATLHQLFEAQARATPDDVALTFGSEHLTYRELNRRANQLAFHLRRQGVRPEDLVGLCVERSFEMVIAMLGIMKSGGAYVPLDPYLPADRLAFMLEDAGARLLVTTRELAGLLPQFEGRTVLIDADQQLIGKHAGRNPTARATAENPVYVMYTSGSTGQPKGVVVLHRGLVNHMCWRQKAHRLQPGDVALHKALLSFDASVWELFWPLLNGIRVVIAPPGGHPDADLLVRMIARERITVIHFVPTTLQLFLQADGLEEHCRSLRYVVSGGDALTPDLKDRFFARLDADLYQSYGPTETSIATIFQRCQRERRERLVPIGRPIHNARAYVLDAHGQPVGIGSVGELYVAGDCVARGYHSRPELTAERFLPDPFGPPDSRMYRTGDLARYLDDGRLEFAGRSDNQVKVRGVRIEPGEIEAVLGRHPAVLEVVVAAPEDARGERRLVAYVGTDGTAVSASELRSFLKQQLPEYLIPSAFVLLDQLPKNPLGKIDRRALPAPGLALAPAPERDYVAPRTSQEAQLVAIWQKVLEVDRVGVHDNFFELGGHSLLATQMVSRVRDQMGQELELRQIFATPTVAALAASMVPAAERDPLSAPAAVLAP
jgi:amino acid adenylation domain-containing protein